MISYYGPIHLTFTDLLVVLGLPLGLLFLLALLATAVPTDRRPERVAIAIAVVVFALVGLVNGWIYWLAFFWPFALAALAFGVGTGVVVRQVLRRWCR